MFNNLVKRAHLFKLYVDIYLVERYMQHTMQKVSIYIVTITFALVITFTVVSLSTGSDVFRLIRYRTLYVVMTLESDLCFTKQ